MSLPEEYDCWRCHECPPGRECNAIWHVCDCCDNHQTGLGAWCDDCGGSGGGHVCEHDNESEAISTIEIIEIREREIARLSRDLDKIKKVRNNE